MEREIRTLALTPAEMHAPLSETEIDGSLAWPALLNLQSRLRAAGFDLGPLANLSAKLPPLLGEWWIARDEANDTVVFKQVVGSFKPVQT